MIEFITIMKDIKDILNNYEEHPNKNVWNRISSELDREYYTLQKQRFNKTIMVASVIGLLSITTIFTVLYISKRNFNRKDTSTAQVQNPEQIIEDNTIINDTISENNAVSTKTVTSVRKTTSDQTPSKEGKKRSSENRQTVENRPFTTNKKTNIEQVVIPANSTLARQLQSDPVLKNMSGEEISFESPISLKIPNLFTPNGDGVNDTFVIEGAENYSNTKLVVRDRTGKIIYQNSNYQNDWNGANCNEGSYNYEFFFNYNGIENSASGKVRIIRN